MESSRTDEPVDKTAMYSASHLHHPWEGQRPVAGKRSRRTADPHPLLGMPGGGAGHVSSRGGSGISGLIPWTEDTDCMSSETRYPPRKNPKPVYSFFFLNEAIFHEHFLKTLKACISKRSAPAQPPLLFHFPQTGVCWSILGVIFSSPLPYALSYDCL